jgi:hypothetical protein
MRRKPPGTIRQSKARRARDFGPGPSFEKRTRADAASSIG